MVNSWFVLFLAIEHKIEVSAECIKVHSSLQSSAQLNLFYKLFAKSAEIQCRESITTDTYGLIKKSGLKFARSALKPSQVHDIYFNFH